MDKMIQYNRCIYGCISTYESLKPNGTVIIDIIEEFISKIVEPINKDLQYRINNRKKFCKYEKSSWEKTKALIKKGKVESINFTCFEEKYIQAHMDGVECPERYISPDLININIMSNEERPDRASLIEFSINKWVCAKDNAQYVCDIYKNLIEKAIDNMECVGGFITIDLMAVYCSFSAHERYVGLEYSYASEKFNEYFRGYSWGNYLSKRHVELLGGIEKIKKEAPVFLVEELNDKGAYLQLTENAEDVTDEDLRKLKRYFIPILPKTNFKLFADESCFRRMIIDEYDEQVFVENNDR